MNKKSQNYSTDRSQIEEIKQRLNIEDIVKRYVKLKHVGKNLFGLCPFHQEDTPSFSVNPELDIYKCFGCGESGDVIDFYQKIEGLEFYEALTRLAKDAGVELKIQKQDPKKAQKYVEAKKINTLAQKFYHYILTQHDAGKNGLRYLNGRGIKNAAIKKFKLGYAPKTRSRKSLINFMKKKSIDAESLLEYGLATERRGSIIDRFTDRIVFSINDTSGNPIAFSGRKLNPNEKRPKYLNSPETIIFKKRKNLYGIDVARRFMRQEEYGILVEGQLDVVSSWQTEVKNIAAPLGTGVTEDQIRLIKKSAPELAIAFDKDSAGQSSSLKAAQIAYELGLDVTIVEIPYGNDADECIRHDPKLWKKALKTRNSAVTYFTEQITKRFGPQSLKSKKLIVTKILPLVASISDKVIQSHHIKELSTITELSEQIIRAELKNIDTKDRNVIQKRISEQLNKQTKSSTLESHLLSLLLQYPGVLDWVSDKVPYKDFCDKNISEIISELIQYHDKEQEFEVSKFIEKIDQNHQSTVRDALMQPIPVTNPSQQDIINEISGVISKIKEKGIRNEIKRLRNQLSKAEKDNNTEEANKIMNEINSTIKELEAFNSEEEKNE